MSLRDNLGRLCLYYEPLPEIDRWIIGDRFLRRIVRGPRRVGGVDKVFLNLRLGLDRLKVEYEVNLPFKKLQADDRVGVFGRGRHCLEGYDRPNPIVAGIGLMTHPSEWPTLCDEYPVVLYLQHSQWANDVYKPYFGERCVVWPVGIDTEKWQPFLGNKRIDFLIYDKIMWERETRSAELVQPILRILEKKGLSFETIRYGEYAEADLESALGRCRAMIFLCEHESQGLAYQECLASGVPILAWDQGWFLDPNRFKWGDCHVRATSVPYWDDRCGVRFQNVQEFPHKLEEFLEKLKQGILAPRDYLLENLTLETCARQYMVIIAAANQTT